MGNKSFSADKPQTSKTANAVSDTRLHSLPLDPVGGIYDLNTVSNPPGSERITVKVTLNGRPHCFEVDSGATCTIISERDFRTLWPKNAPALRQDPVALRTWTQEPLQVLGTLTTDVAFQGRHHSLPLLVVKGGGSALLGRTWFQPLGIRILGIQSTESVVSPELRSVFDEGLGHEGHGNADAFSRLPLPVFTEVRPPPLSDVLLVESESAELPLDASRISKMTQTDKVLSRVMSWLLHGFPPGKVALGDLFEPFLRRRSELSTYKGCLLWGSRVVIPEKARDSILILLHDGHPGIVRMKALARSYVWCRKMDLEIEQCVNTCTTCQLTRNAPAKAPVISWERPANPWSRLNIDFAGPYKGKTFLLVVDAHSKWLEVLYVNSMTSAAVIREVVEWWRWWWWWWWPTVRLTVVVEVVMVANG